MAVYRCRQACLIALAALPVIALLAAGCDMAETEPQRRVYIKPPPERWEVESQQYVVAPRPSPPPPGPDAMPDFLSGPSATPEPTPAGDIAANGDTLDKPASMPTGHTHWVRGTISGGAHLNIQVNSTSLGSFSGAIDRDITWKCHKGMNTITFAWAPGSSPDAKARLEVVEGEQETVKPALITWNRTAGGGSGSEQESSSSASPASETLSFNAR